MYNKIIRILILIFIFFIVFSSKSYGQQERRLTEYLEVHGEEIALEYNLDWNLVKAVLFLESRYNFNCVSHNYDRAGNIISTDQGLAQINDKYLNFYGSLANLEEPNPFNPIHSIKMCCAGLNYWREYGVNEGYENEELILFYLNSYNAGAYGYINYIKKHKTMKRAYSDRVLEFKAMIDEYGYILD